MDVSEVRRESEPERDQKQEPGSERKEPVKEEKTPLNKRSSMERLTSTIMKMKEFHHHVNEEEKTVAGVEEEEEEEKSGRDKKAKSESVAKIELDQLEVLMRTDRR